MSKPVWLSIVGVSLLELDTWVTQTMWLALLGVVLLCYSMALIAQEEK
jgi:hypothetical protein